jgi:hypothetical protein
MDESCGAVHRRSRTLSRHSILGICPKRKSVLSIPAMSIDGGLPRAGDPSPLVIMQIKNSGRSTAVVGRFVFNQASGIMAPMPETREYKEGQSQLSAPPPIPANTIIPVRNHLRMFTQEEIDAIKAGKNRLAFFGYVEYTDEFWLFGNKTTGYCFNYSSTESQWVDCPERDYTYVK